MKRKGKPFLEVFASALREDYPFPLLEVFAFLYGLNTFALISTTAVTAFSEEQTVFNFISSSLSYSLLAFYLLIFKNICYGLGSDLEKGTIQTLFSYPLKRYAILSAKLLSALGVAALLLVGVQTFAFSVLAPALILRNWSIFLLTFIAILEYPFFLAAIVLFVTLKIRRGGLALVSGIVVYFAAGIFSLFVTHSAYFGDLTSLKIIALINPSHMLVAYYYSIAGWKPIFTEVLIYIGIGYSIVTFLFFLSYLYFCKRLNL